MRSIKIAQSITDRQDASLGVYFRDVSKLPLLSAEEEYKVAEKAKNGDKKALDKLVTSNLRFVISVAKQYQGKGLPLIDLIQSGSFGLIESAKRFDPDKGYKFISFAVWWIRQAIIKSLSDNCRTVRLPTSQISNISKISKATEKLERENGILPSMEELENETDLSMEKINSSVSAISKSISLDTPFNSEDVNCLLDMIPDSNSKLADANLCDKDRTIEIERILNSLPYRDGDVIKMSFGIGMSPMPNEEIAKRLGIGSERVRQIQKETLKFLRKNYINEFKELL